jgi:rhomboid protease GluP
VLPIVFSGSELRLISGMMSILSPSPRALILFGASGSIPVFAMGNWWTLLSATWLHGNLLHIVFNMMWVRDLGPATANIIGPARTVIIYTLAGVCGFFFSSVAGEFGGFGIPMLRGASLTVGASASVFGLLGAMVHYGRKSGSSLVRAEAGRYAMILFVFGLIMPGVDNFAHAGGFIGGYGISAFFNPSRRRGDHMIGAALCLAATVLAVIFSVLVGLPWLKFRRYLGSGARFAARFWVQRAGFSLNQPGTTGSTPSQETA